MTNNRMYVRPTGESFPFIPTGRGQANRMITSEGAWVNMNSYYNRGIRSGSLELVQPPPSKDEPAPAPVETATKAAPVDPPKTSKRAKSKKRTKKMKRGTK